VKSLVEEGEGFSSNLERKMGKLISVTNEKLQKIEGFVEIYPAIREKDSGA